MAPASILGRQRATGCAGRPALTGTGVRFYRFCPAASALLIFFAFSYLYLHPNHDLYFAVLRYYGVDPFHFPFVDISGSLAAWECARQGIDVIVSDPCDVLLRPYSYSPIWMSWSAIPLGVADTPMVGWIVGLIFLLSLSVLPRTRRPLELFLVLAATLSPVVVFAIERANPDILLFLLALVTGLATEGGVAVRCLGYALALLSGLVKYYPIVTLLLTFQERMAVFLFAGAAVTLSLTSFGIAYYEEIVRSLPYIPSGPYTTDLFGAKNLPLQLAEMLGTALGPSGLAALLARAVAVALFVFLISGCVAVGRRAREARLPQALMAVSSRERNLLLLGSAVICGCFFAGQNICYRGIFLLLVLPGLLAVSRGNVGCDARKMCLGTSVAIVLLMWSECFRHALDSALDTADLPSSITNEVHALFWLARELAWWRVVGVLFAVLSDFLWRSATVQEVASWFVRRRAVAVWCVSQTSKRSRSLSCRRE